MRHRKKTVVLGREKGPREALLRNLATSVVLYERVQTTRAKAKAVQPIVERVITAGRRKKPNALKEIGKVLQTDGAIRKVLDELGPRYASRDGGYTRITRIGYRQGDAAEMVQIEFV
jgi:large subunit ribosomal protein L17